MFKALIIILLTLKGVLMAIEEPKYTVIEKYEAFEIRKYESFLVAQTEVSGAFDERGGKAFRILIKYISGENQKQNNIKMTAPVIEESKNDSNSAVISFIMPENFTLDSLPTPIDNRIILKENSAKNIAVLEYNGGWGEEKYKENEAILLKALQDANIKTIGKPNFARYNSPFALWFMRRNEIMIEVQR